MLSMSRIRQAICARFAASATSVKSFRKESVEADFIAGGGGGTMVVGDCCDEGRADVCCDIGDVMGAFIVEDKFVFGLLVWCVSRRPAISIWQSRIGIQQKEDEDMFEKGCLWGGVGRANMLWRGEENGARKMGPLFRLSPGGRR